MNKPTEQPSQQGVTLQDILQEVLDAYNNKDAAMLFDWDAWAVRAEEAISRPTAPSGERGIEFLMHGKKMAFKIGNQMFTLDYAPDEPEEFEFMKNALTHAISTITPDVKVTFLAKADQSNTKGAIAQAVDRFLGWRLPQDFAPDCGISFTPIQHGTVISWPTGTSLFTADQARQMLEYMLSASPAAPEAAKPTEYLVEAEWPDRFGVPLEVTQVIELGNGKVAIRVKPHEAREQILAAKPEMQGERAKLIARLAVRAVSAGWISTAEGRALLAEGKAGDIVVTKTTSGQIVAVTRQDDEGRILEVIAESEVADDKAGGEPVGKVINGKAYFFDEEKLPDETKLYTHPQPQAEAVRVLAGCRAPMYTCGSRCCLAAKRDELADEYRTGLDSPPV